MIRRGTSYGPMLPDGVLEDDGVDRGIVFVFAGAHLKRQFEFVKTQWLNDGIFIGAPAESDPLVGPHDGAGTLHHPAAADPPPAARACRRSSSPAAASTASRPACARCAGWASWTRDERREHDVATPHDRAPTAGRRWTSPRRPPMPRSPSTPVLLDYASDGRVAVITLNRPHADNAITHRDGRAADRDRSRRSRCGPPSASSIITGAGDRAFSVGSDLRQRKNMTKEDWLRQRQDFDRTLYTLRQLRKPIFAAVNGIAYGGGSRDRPEHRLHHRLRATRRSASPRR